jgi:hypothetical protein
VFKRVVGCVQVLEVSETRTQGVLGVVELRKWLHLFPKDSRFRQVAKEKKIIYLFFGSLARRVDPTALSFSFSSHRHSYISLLFTADFG